MIREFKLGMGYVKMRLIKNYILFLSKERELIFYNIQSNQKNKIVKSENDVTFSDFVILDGKNKDILLSGFDEFLYVSKNSNLIKCSYKVEGNI